MKKVIFILSIIIIILISFIIIYKIYNYKKEQEAIKINNIIINENAELIKKYNEALNNVKIKYITKEKIKNMTEEEKEYFILMCQDFKFRLEETNLALQYANKLLLKAYKKHSFGIYTFVGIDQDIELSTNLGIKYNRIFRLPLFNFYFGGGGGLKIYIEQINFIYSGGKFGGHILIDCGFQW